MQPDLWLNQEIGSYRLIDRLGQGGMGVVYLGRHPAIGKRVAIKVLNPQRASEEFVMRFFQEAKAVNEIGHPNVVDVLDFGQTPDGQYYLIMEHLSGASLSAEIAKAAPFTEERIIHIGRQLCAALAAAHEKNIIHRDLKPDNIFLCQRDDKQDFVKVLDFGIAKILYDENTPVHTMAGAVMGTPSYMAPEQALGAEITASVDIYALGIILYQMATASLPYSDTNRIALAMQHINKELPPPRNRNPALSEAMAAVITRCLAKEKAQRYPSMRALSEALQTATPVPMASLPAPRTLAPRRAGWLIAALLVAGLVVGGGLWLQGSKQGRSVETLVPVAAHLQPATSAPVAKLSPKTNSGAASEAQVPCQQGACLTPLTPAAANSPVKPTAPKLPDPKPVGTMTIDPFQKTSKHPVGTMTIDPFKN